MRAYQYFPVAIFQWYGMAWHGFYDVEKRQHNTFTLTYVPRGETAWCDDDDNTHQHAMCARKATTKKRKKSNRLNNNIFGIVPSRFVCLYGDWIGRKTRNKNNGEKL